MSQPSDAWSEWQRDHAAALAALQEAQRAYHRAAVGHQPAVGGSQAAVDSRRSSLEAVDAARARLDDVRARKPE
jgi:hypothetical protein